MATEFKRPMSPERSNGVMVYGQPVYGNFGAGMIGIYSKFKGQTEKYPDQIYVYQYHSNEQNPDDRQNTILIAKINDQFQYHIEHHSALRFFDAKKAQKYTPPSDEKTITYTDNDSGPPFYREMRVHIPTRYFDKMEILPSKFSKFPEGIIEARELAIAIDPKIKSFQSPEETECNCSKVAFVIAGIVGAVIAYHLHY